MVRSFRGDAISRSDSRIRCARRSCPVRRAAPGGYRVRCGTSLRGRRGERIVPHEPSPALHKSLTRGVDLGGCTRSPSPVRSLDAVTMRCRTPWTNVRSARASAFRRLMSAPRPAAEGVDTTMLFAPPGAGRRRTRRRGPRGARRRRRGPHVRGCRIAPSGGGAAAGIASTSRTASRPTPCASAYVNARAALRRCPRPSSELRRRVGEDAPVGLPPSVNVAPVPSRTTSRRQTSAAAASMETPAAIRTFALCPISRAARLSAS